jgi:glycosyltransferase involved in cell wall biosynthesis
VAEAVNTGLEQARGKYVVLVDADDLLARRALALLLDQIKKTSSALVVGQHLGFDQKLENFYSELTKKILR